MNIKSLIGQKIAVHCATEEEANKFLTMCKNEQRMWSGGVDVSIPHSAYRSHGSETAYTLTDGCLNFCSRSWYVEHGYNVVLLSDVTPVPIYAPESRDFIDRAAIAAMQGLCIDSAAKPNVIAADAYLYAIAMHEERNRIFNEVK